jgi:glycosyltransferase involved in cell wall biosynthesis
MRVVFFIHYVELYGANRSLLNLIDGLKPHGVEAFVVAPYEGDMTAALRGREVPVLIVPLQWWSSEYAPSKDFPMKILKYLSWRIGAITRLAKNLRITRQVSRQLKKWNVDILYTNSSVIPIGAMVEMWMRKPHVWHLREFGTLDYGLTFEWGIPLFKFFIRRADAQICVSRAIRSFYSKALTAGKSYVVYNGVATKAQIENLYKLAHSSYDPKEYFVFAIIGKIQRSKGQDIAIRALALLEDSCPTARLIIAGGDDREGEEIKQLQELAASLDVTTKVTFLGHITNPYDVYRQTDAVLMCSKYEAMGRVTVEAMTACKPVIGFNSGGTSEIIVNQVNGLLYEGEHEELASCMRRFVENPIWAREMGENGCRMAKKKYSIEAYAGKIYEILSGVINCRDGNYRLRPE